MDEVDYVEIDLPFPGALSAQNRGNWRNKAKPIADLRFQAKMIALEATDSSRPNFDRAIVHYEFFVPDRGRRDEGNLIYQRTGYIVDGHERVMQALGAGDDTLVDVEYVDLSEEDERKLLLILDASSELAEVDACDLEELLRTVNTSSQELADWFTELGEAANIFDPEPPEQFPEVDEGIETEHECPKCGYKWSGGK